MLTRLALLSRSLIRRSERPILKVLFATFRWGWESSGAGGLLLIRTALTLLTHYIQQRCCTSAEYVKNWRKTVRELARSSTTTKISNQLEMHILRINMQ